MASLTIEQIQGVLREKNPASLVLAEHTETGHFYRHVPTNQVFASVTTKCGILDAPHLKKWAARLAVEHLVQKVQLLPIQERTLERMALHIDEAILVHQDQFTEAGDLGTRGHGYVEDYLMDWMKTGYRPSDIRTFVKDEDARVFAAARSAELFCKEWNVLPIASEMKVASVRYRYAGTLDSLMMVLRQTDKGDGSCLDQNSMFDGKPREHHFLSTSAPNPNKVRCVHCGTTGEYEFSIVDWKTSNSIDKVEYAMQTAAYWQALFEMTGLKPKNIFIVRLDKTQARYEVRRLTNRPKAFKAFADCAKIYDWLNDGTEKLIPANPKKITRLTDMQTV